MVVEPFENELIFTHGPKLLADTGSQFVQDEVEKIRGEIE